jgi:hypothetical protein
MRSAETSTRTSLISSFLVCLSFSGERAPAPELFLEFNKIARCKGVMAVIKGRSDPHESPALPSGIA